MYQSKGAKMWRRLFAKYQSIAAFGVDEMCCSSETKKGCTKRDYVPKCEDQKTNVMTNRNRREK